MKNILLSLIAMLFAINVYAQPSTITYQGVLTDASGVLITGTPNITFALYDASTNGTLLWTETQNTVSVTNGLFQVALNSVNNNWATANFASNMWLQITVGSTTLSPRVAFNASGYSLSGHATSLKIATDAGDGKVLTSDVNGNGSWQTASSGGPTILRATSTGNSFSIGSGDGYYLRQSFTVTGAAVGDVAIVNLTNISTPPTSTPYTSNMLNYFAWVSATNTVTVQYNDSGCGCTSISNATVLITVIKAPTP